MSSPNASPSAHSRRLPALVLASASLLSIALMAQHPTSPHAAQNELVHGGLVALLLAILFGFLGLADRLGWRLARVRFALIAHSVGVVWLACAALVNGFVVAGLASDARGIGHHGVDAAVREPIFELCHRANQVLAAAGTLAVSAAMVGWSSALLWRRGGGRLVGLLGVLVGGLCAVGLLAGRLELDVHGMAAVVLAQAVWNVGAAAWMLRDGARAIDGQR